VPVASKKSGMFECTLNDGGSIAHTPAGIIFEKRLIEAYISENGTDPVTNEELTVEDLVDLKSDSTVRPRPPTLTSIPSLLSVFQNEWDALALETYQLKQQLAQTRQELSTALYQHDAAVRVIARLSRERDEAREALSKLSINGNSAGSGEAMQVDNSGLPEELVAVVTETQSKYVAQLKVFWFCLEGMLTLLKGYRRQGGSVQCLKIGQLQILSSHSSPRNSHPGRADLDHWQLTAQETNFYKLDQRTLFKWFRYRRRPSLRASSLKLERSPRWLGMARLLWWPRLPVLSSYTREKMRLPALINMLAQQMHSLCIRVVL
jgi:hypothetical protein